MLFPELKSIVRLSPFVKKGGRNLLYCDQIFPVAIRRIEPQHQKLHCVELSATKNNRCLYCAKPFQTFVLRLRLFRAPLYLKILYYGKCLMTAPIETRTPISIKEKPLSGKGRQLIRLQRGKKKYALVITYSILPLFTKRFKTLYTS